MQFISSSFPTFCPKHCFDIVAFAQETEPSVTDDENGTSLAQASEPTVEEPDTTESETTAGSHHGDYGSLDIQEEPEGTTEVANAGASEKNNADAEGVAAVQAGLQNVDINEQ